VRRRDTLLPRTLHFRPTIAITGDDDPSTAMPAPT
jgi:hypothetical protein